MCAPLHFSAHTRSHTHIYKHAPNPCPFKIIAWHLKNCLMREEKKSAGRELLNKSIFIELYCWAVALPMK